MKLTSAVLLSFGLLVGCASGGTRVPSRLTVPVGEQTEGACQVAREALAVWIPRLELQPWTFTFHCETPPEYGDGAAGEIHIRLEDRAADIWMNPNAADPEVVIVHELLHILLYYVQEANSVLISEQVNRILTAHIMRGYLRK